MKTAKFATKVSKSSSKPKDAIELLKADHQKVDKLFEKYRGSESQADKVSIVGQICNELTVHAQIEEEIFYPQVQTVVKDKELIPEAVVEHATLKYLIEQITEAPDDELFGARVTVLSEYVKHHVKEEQDEIFPMVKDSELDLLAIGEQLELRKEELSASINE